MNGIALSLQSPNTPTRQVDRHSLVLLIARCNRRVGCADRVATAAWPGLREA
jgi:hypothetical protein